MLAGIGVKWNVFRFLSHASFLELISLPCLKYIMSPIMFSSHQVWSNFYNPQNWVEEIIENTKTVQLAGDVIPMSGKGSRQKD